MWTPCGARVQKRGHEKGGTCLVSVMQDVLCEAATFARSCIPVALTVRPPHNNNNNNNNACTEIQAPL